MIDVSYFPSVNNQAPGAPTGGRRPGEAPFDRLSALLHIAVDFRLSNTWAPWPI